MSKEDTDPTPDQSQESNREMNDTGSARQKLNQRSIHIIAMAVGVFLVLAVPFLVGSYYTEIIAGALILAIFAVSVDLVWGYSGILTFGHAAFFGFGAYVMAMLTTTYALSGVDYIGLAAGFLLPAMLGLLVAGLLFYRGISRESFTIITLALAIIANQTAASLNDITGGANGILGIPSLNVGIPSIWMTPITNEAFYYAMVLVTIGVYLIARQIIKSPFGRVLIAISDNEAKARAMGYDTAKYKTYMFGISGGIAGFAGSLYATYANFVSPPLLGFVQSTEVLIWVIIGGRGTLVGPIVGTLFLNLFERLMGGFFVVSWTLILGILLVGIVLLAPEGIFIRLVAAYETVLDSFPEKES